jgi:hypothetical protein
MEQMFYIQWHGSVGIFFKPDGVGFAFVHTDAATKTMCMVDFGFGTAIDRTHCNCFEMAGIHTGSASSTLLLVMNSKISGSFKHSWRWYVILINILKDVGYFDSFAAAATAVAQCKHPVSGRVFKKGIMHISQFMRLPDGFQCFLFGGIVDVQPLSAFDGIGGKRFTDEHADMIRCARVFDQASADAIAKGNGIRAVDDNLIDHFISQNSFGPFGVNVNTLVQIDNFIGMIDGQDFSMISGGQIGQQRFQ